MQYHSISRQASLDESIRHSSWPVVLHEAETGGVKRCSTGDTSAEEDDVSAWDAVTAWDAPFCQCLLTAETSTAEQKEELC